jgi:uncharacterized membrane protein
MPKIGVFDGFVRLIERWRFTALLGLLLVVIFAQPLMRAGDVERIFIVALLGGVFAGTIHATRESSGLPTSVQAVAALWLVVALAALVTEHRWLDMAGVLASVSLGLLVSWSTFAALFREAKADGDALAGAVFGFFLLAVVWSEIYRAIEILHPGSFLLAGEVAPHGEFLYLSLVTLTTLGYGDFLPVSPLARVLTGVEAAFGTLYIAILIGRIVGVFRSPGRD